MSKKTPIQQIIAESEKYRDSLAVNSTEFMAANVMLNMMRNLLPVERECIEGAYNSGYYKGADREEFKDDNYFTNTYEQI